MYTINLDNYYFDVIQTMANFEKWVFNHISKKINGRADFPPPPSRVLCNFGSPGQLGIIAQLIYGLNLKWIYNRDYNGKCAQEQKILKKALSHGPSASVRPLLNSNVTKVNIIKWFQSCTRTIRSCSVRITKYLKNA